MEKYGRAGQATDDSIKRRMHIACWITKATDTHLKYVILIAFAQLHMLGERDSMSCLYVHCLSCYSLQIQICCFTVNCTRVVALCTGRNGLVVCRKHASCVYSTSSLIIWWWPLCFGSAGK